MDVGSESVRRVRRAGVPSAAVRRDPRRHRGAVRSRRCGRWTAARLDCAQLARLEEPASRGRILAGARLPRPRTRDPRRQSDLRLGIRDPRPRTDRAARLDRQSRVPASRGPRRLHPRSGPALLHAGPGRPPGHGRLRHACARTSAHRPASARNSGSSRRDSKSSSSRAHSAAWGPRSIAARNAVSASSLLPSTASTHARL